jgi:hypothetical protein
MVIATRSCERLTRHRPPAAPPSETGNCVSRFTSVLGQAGVAGDVIRFGAHDIGVRRRAVG